MAGRRVTPKTRFASAGAARLLPRLFPRVVRPLIPVLDRLSKHALKRSRSPYIARLAQIADTLDVSGVWLLQMPPTNGAAPPRLRAKMASVAYSLRSIGRSTDSAGRLSCAYAGPGGDFISATWPVMSVYLQRWRGVSPRAQQGRCSDGPGIAGCGMRLRSERIAQAGGSRPLAAGPASAARFRSVRRFCRRATAP